MLDRRGRALAHGLADSGPIAVRIFADREPVDEQLLERRLADAVALRERVIPPDTTAYRLVHGEGDRVPGFVVDVYGQSAVLRTDGTAARRWRDVFMRALAPILRARDIESLLIRGDRREGSATSLALGPDPPEIVEVTECGMVLCANLFSGQKTGLFLDHRDSRRRVRELARGKRVLDLFAYTGGFSAAAGLGGAEHVVTVDRARPAIELAKMTWTKNRLVPARQRTHVVPVAEFLARDEGVYDLVIADPPSFAPNEASVSEALRSYRALHESAMRRLAPRGLYLAASCSSHVRSGAFEETLHAASRRLGRAVELIDRWGAGPDHPCLPVFPEGDYLKVLLARART